MAGGRIDIASNVLVPPHEIVPKKEHEKLLAELGIKREQLPKIKVTDPQAKRLGAKVGDIIKIKRKDTAENIYYRLVIKD